MALPYPTERASPLTLDDKLRILGRSCGHSPQWTQSTHARRSYRVRYDVRLDVMKDRDFEVAEIMKEATGRGEKTEMIRRGVLLVHSLLQGDTSYLEAYYPEVVKKLRTEGEQRAQTGAIAELQMLLQSGNFGVPRQSFVLTPDDDYDDIVAVDIDHDEDCIANLLD